MNVRNLYRLGAILGLTVLFVSGFLPGIAAASVTEVSTSQPGQMHMDGGHSHGGPGSFGWWMPFVMPVLWLGVLLGVGYLVYRAIVGSGGQSSGLEELKRAYARGDISDDEFDRKLDRIES